jgi:CDP-diacylglycerol---serine O-phosphatidyltransferase
MLSEKKRKFRRGIYILPNLFTIAALFAGFYAIVAAMKGIYDAAAIAIFVAMLLDSLDGRIARLTNTQTEFGAQLDSLSDMVCFGVAPALVMYSWALFGLGKVGWLMAFIYAAAVALRLARFNTQLGKTDKRYFQGLACTPAAGVMAGLVWIGAEYSLFSDFKPIVAGIISVLIGILMVSNIRFHSFKDFDLRNNVSFLKILMIVSIIVLIAIDPSVMLFAIFFIYAIFTPLINLWKLHKKHLIKKRLNLVK